MKFGIDVLLDNPEKRKPIRGKKVALLAHPASVTENLDHSLDVLARLDDIKLTAAFGPQHGLRGDKQDNMIESQDFHDPVHDIPVFSLYGEVRKPTDRMMQEFDILLIDLQDIGCRIYTFETTLLYMLEAAAKHGKAVWVLDRPNPAGRPVEGFTLKRGFESFVGAGPFPLRHGLTLGELAHWYRAKFSINVDLKVIEMNGWLPDERPGYGWPVLERSWVNPSPNAASFGMTRAYAGSVMIEGTTISEARGTTRPLELMGAPDLCMDKILSCMQKTGPSWMQGCVLRPCWFEPTFHKHMNKLCQGIQIHADGIHYDHEKFRPWRLVSLFLKSVRLLYPDYCIWHDQPYEYEHDRLAIDLINGTDLLRKWVDEPQSTPADLDNLATKDEQAWIEERGKYLLYPI